MERRIKIDEIVAATGFSRATVDRVLNGRPGVHARTKRLILNTQATLGRINPTADGRPAYDQALGDAVGTDIVMRLGRGLSDQLVRARALLGTNLEFFDFYQRDDEDVHERVADLCRDASRPLIVAAKNTQKICAELIAARRRGKRVISMVSDLNQDARDAFVGIDNRMAGQTAAFIIGNLLRGRTVRVGVVLGNHSFRCHEDREIGFRSHLRAGFPHLSLADIALGEDSVEKTYEAARVLLRAEPDLQAIYNVGGGNVGLARALVEDGRAGTVFVVTHETNHITIPLTREGTLHFLIGQNTRDMLQTAMHLAVNSNAAMTDSASLLDFFVFTRFNLPAGQVGFDH